MENAVIYARYSSERQTEQSIEGQLRVCKEFAEKNDYRIVGKYIDRAVSGKTDNRDEFQRMIKDSAKGAFSFVIVYKLDRFARNRYDSAINKAVLKKNGVKVLSACEQITDTPEGIILESMLEGYAEYYSAELSQKVRRGLKESRIKGNFTGGFVLYGYKIIDKKWVINESESGIVKRIFSEYISGRRLKDIADNLNEMGIKTNTGKPFTVNIISRLLKNKKFAGIVSADEEYTNIVPAIVSKEDYDQAQRMLERNKRLAASYKPEVPYLLSGKLFCGYCDTLMTGESGTSKMGVKFQYYKCFKRKKTHDCDKKTLPKEDFENKIIKMTLDHILKPDVMKGIAENVTVVYNKDIDDQTILETLEKQKGDKEKAINNLLKALEMGIFTPSTKQRLEQLEKEKGDLESEWLVQYIFAPKRYEVPTVLEYFQGFAKLDYSIEENRAKLLNMFVRKVIAYDDKEPTIYYNTSGDFENNPIKENEPELIGFGFKNSGGGDRIRTCVGLLPN